MKNRYLCSILFFTVCFMAESQQLTPEQQQYIGQVIETLTEQNETAEDVSDVFDNLLTFLRKPLNINTASFEELAELHVLNAFQIAALIDYRKTHGALLTIYELLYIPGYRQEDIELIGPFIVCSDPEQQNIGFKSYVSPVKQQVLVRYQRILEEQKGYIPIPDSILASEPEKTRYMGSPDKIYCRYRIDAGEKMRAGILMEKDAGEEFFTGSNKRGFDFYTGYIGYTNKRGILRKVLLGDYHLQMGQGLLAWSSYAYGKSSYPVDICRRKELIKANSSAEENRFFRGTALTVGIEKFSLTAFASAHGIDASVVHDTVLHEDFISGFITTGYHATPSDVAKEKAVNFASAGGRFAYSGSRFTLGFNCIAMKTDKSLMKQDAMYKQYYFSGNRNTGFSADYRYMGRQAQFFGETAVSNRSYATLNGMLVYLTSEMYLGVLHRHYNKSYYSYWADAFRENTDVRNENGFYLGFEGRFSDNYFRIYSDIFSFPWLRYRVNVPSEGYEVFGEWNRTFGEAVILARYKRREKPVNFVVSEHVYEVFPQVRENYRLTGIFPVGRIVALQNRIELCRAGFRNDTLRTGVLLLQDIMLRSLPFPVDVSIRFGYFHTANYDTRIYAYERDVLYAATSQMHYGKGWRYMLLLKWQPSRNLGFWFKIAQSRYPDEDSIGSGLSEIQGNHRTEVKVQMAMNF